MELAIRTLRDGALADAAAPLLLLCDGLAVSGGPALLRKAVAELIVAIAEGRAQAAALTLVALEHPAAMYQQLCVSAALQPSVKVLDGFSNPFSWASCSSGSNPSSAGAAQLAAHMETASALVPLPGLLAMPDGLRWLSHHLQSTLQPLSPGSRQCIIIDSLTPLLDQWGPASVAHFLHNLLAAAGTSCMLCGLHTDLHPPQHVAAVEQLAAGGLQLQPVGESEQSVCAATHGVGSVPQGRLRTRIKRRTGRVRCETQLYRINGAGDVRFLEVPADALNPQAAAERAAAAAAMAGSGAAQGHAGGARPGPSQPAALAQQLAGGMKLELSAAELEARRRVQLPFEHQGQAAHYQTEDFRDYLPPQAGGKAAHASAAAAASLGGATAPELGRILYLRDSASEHDSTEDPDDDLDI